MNLIEELKSIADILRTADGYDMKVGVIEEQEMKLRSIISWLEKED